MAAARGKYLINTTTTSTGSTPAFTSDKATMTFNNALGMASGIGVMYYIKPALAITAEAYVMTMSLYLKTLTLDGNTINFTNKTYVNGTDQPIESLPYSNIGLKLGLQLDFGKNSFGEYKGTCIISKCPNLKPKNLSII